jgi:4-hydroxybenzoate polyprenyltransferase
LLCLYLAGLAFELGLYYNAALVVAAGLFVYQQYLIRERRPDACFKAFLHNNWVGMSIFAGVVLNYLVANV